MGTAGVPSGAHLCRCAAALALLALLLLLPGCGGSDSSATTSGETTEAPVSKEPEPEEPGATVSTGIPGSAGRVVVDGTGYTLYHFSKDERNSGETGCYGRCARVWPPYLTNGEPGVVLKARQSEVGTIERKDGTTQVTYGGWPVYTHSRDGWPLSARAHESAGEEAGAGRSQFGGVWYVVRPNGEVVR